MKVKRIIKIKDFILCLAGITISAYVFMSLLDKAEAQPSCVQDVIVRNSSGDLTYGWPENPSEWLAPRALVVDSKGNIYIGDYVNYRVLKFDKNGRFVFQYSLQPPQKYQLHKKEDAGKVGGSHLIQDMTVDKDDNLYVLSFYESRVEIYKPNGSFIKSFNYFDEEILGPRGSIKKINVDTRGNIYLYDPSLGGGVYSSAGRLIKKGIIVDEFGRGKINYDETQIADFNGLYYEVESYNLNNKRFCRLIIRDRANKIIKRCDGLRIADDHNGFIYKSDREGNIYTYDYYSESLDVIKIKTFIKATGK